MKKGIACLLTIVTLCSPIFALSDIITHMSTPVYDNFSITAYPYDANVVGGVVKGTTSGLQAYYPNPLENVDVAYDYVHMEVNNTTYLRAQRIYSVADPTAEEWKFTTADGKEVSYDKFVELWLSAWSNPKNYLVCYCVLGTGWKGDIPSSDRSTKSGWKTFWVANKPSFNTSVNTIAKRQLLDFAMYTYDRENYEFGKDIDDEWHVFSWVENRVDYDPLLGFSSLEAIAYVNHETKNIVIAFAGTNDKLEWINHVEYLYSHIQKQEEAAADFVNYVVNYPTLRGYNLYFTGHSLGGYLAQVAAATLDAKYQPQLKEIVTFNAFSPHKDRSDLLDQLTMYAKEGKVTMYSIEGDVVSGMGKSYTKKKTFNPKYNVLIPLIKQELNAHKLSEFYRFELE